MRDLIDWALGFGGSPPNLITRTPAEGTYESPTVCSLWDSSRAVANADLALVALPAEVVGAGAFRGLGLPLGLASGPPGSWPRARWRC